MSGEPSELDFTKAVWAWSGAMHDGNVLSICVNATSEEEALNIGTQKAVAEHECNATDFIQVEVCELLMISEEGDGNVGTA